MLTWKEPRRSRPSRSDRPFLFKTTIRSRSKSGGGRNANYAYSLQGAKETALVSAPWRPPARCPPHLSATAGGGRKLRLWWWRCCCCCCWFLAAPASLKGDSTFSPLLLPPPPSQSCGALLNTGGPAEALLLLRGAQREPGAARLPGMGRPLLKPHLGKLRREGRRGEGKKKKNPGCNAELSRLQTPEGNRAFLQRARAALPVERSTASSSKAWGGGGRVKTPWLLPSFPFCDLPAFLELPFAWRSAGAAIFPVRGCSCPFPPPGTEGGKGGARERQPA